MACFLSRDFDALASAENEVLHQVMRVFLISTSYPRDISDWRGIFMRHLVAALARVPSIKRSVWAPPGDLPEQATTIVSPADAR